uniref:P-loop containing nucleoside triphosphate hydrolase protein n=1 Tax=Mycena chlorophos TaxID=658473 RepID=A0ABQ0M773_MYCCL|nr:predicted protein [Mycena chlorophos]
MRASSRVAGPPSANKKRKFIRRIAPPQIVTPLEGEPYYEAIDAYSKRFLEMVQCEQSESETVMQERLSTWKLARLQDEGYCILGLTAFWVEENRFSRPVAIFMLGPGMGLPEHRFEIGTQVLLSRADPLTELECPRGTVVARTAHQLSIAFWEPFDGLDEGEWRMDVGHSDITYDRMRAAIMHLNQNPAELEVAAPVEEGRQLILRGTYLRDVLLRSSQPDAAADAPMDLGSGGAFKDDQRIHSWARRYSMPAPLVMEGDPPLEGLNRSQIQAIAMMLSERISLVQGPPGTGKTKTIIEAIKLLKMHFEVPHPLLVCTYTNVAVDHLVEGLAATGLKPLRVGFAGQVRESLMQHTVDYKMERHPLKPALNALGEQSKTLRTAVNEIAEKARDLEKRKEKMTTEKARERAMLILANMASDIEVKERTLRSLKARIFAVQSEMRRDILAESDVICSTCITSASWWLELIDFPVVFLDEASMSTEPASLIPLMKGSQHVALIGDHKQLPPIISSEEARDLGLGKSLFERLTEEGVAPTIMLDTQYRMHPGISLFPSSEFYNFLLQDGTIDASGNVSPRLAPPNSIHLKEDANGNRPAVIFLDHTGNEAIRDKSRVNHNEARIVLGVIEDLLLNNPALKGEDIGIIAPYAAQITLIMRLLNSRPEYFARFVSVLGEQRARQLANIEVRTVDGFEGREKEVIIFSTVRNNAGGHIGFLADQRRLNVGLTRAKRGLFVVGSLSTLGRGVRGIEANANAAKREHEPVVVQPGEVKVIPAKEEKPLKVKAQKKNLGRGGDKEGLRSWKRYAEWLLERGLVVRIGPMAIHAPLVSGVKASRLEAAVVL